MINDENNVISLFPYLNHIFDNLICACGCEYFFLSVNLKAVCVDCRGWMDGCIDLEGDHQ